MSRNYKGKKGNPNRDSHADSKEKRVRSRSKDTMKEAGLDSRGRDNDPGYYFTSKELAQQAAQLSFQNVLGNTPLIDNYSAPTVAIIKMNPCPGYSYRNERFVRLTQSLPVAPDASNDPDDSINLMAIKTYTLLSSFSGRTSTYQPCDVGLMELAVASISEYSEHIRRTFGLALTYNPRNRYIPKGLIDSLGFDSADLFANLPKYRMAFNVLMTQINQIPLLDNIGYIRKSREIYQKIYQDSPSSMSQLIAMVPNSIWILDESTYSTGSILDTEDVVYGTMQTHLDRLKRMIDAILYSSTLNIVYADILNLANKMKVPTWQFDYLAENYIVMPEYNQNFLLQFHNMTVVGKPYEWSLTSYPYDTNTAWRSSGTPSGTSWTVSYHLTRGNRVTSDANTGKIVYCPVFSTSAKSNHDRVIDVLNDDPTTVDIIEAMRYTVAWSGCKVPITDSSASSTVPVNVFYSLTDHYAVGVDIYSSYGETPESIAESDLFSWATTGVPEFTSKLSQFEYAPILYGMFSTTGFVVDLLFGDLGFNTNVNYPYLVRNNRIMYEGLFDFRT